MGKGIASRHQKFVKSEKSKVKLKGKKELPKGTNVTKTAFKIKKIVIREQVKVSSDDQPLSRAKLNIKELLTRLSHFNATARGDAVTGLKEIISSHQIEVLSNHLGQLLKGIAPLFLDLEKHVRRESFKLLHMVLSPLPVEKIAPFFEILCSYLRCAMTHINTHIHEDSLLCFDVVLLCAPNLIATNVHKVLPSFLDMISKLRLDSKPGRTLMVNLGSKMTSVKWRIKVLSRLHQLLQTLIDIRNKQNESSLHYNDNNWKTYTSNRCTQHYNSEVTNYFPIFKFTPQKKLLCFSQNKSMYFENQNEESKIRSYVDVLVPLLFETWLEVKPSSSGDTKRVESVLSEEAILLLRYILQIFFILWNLICLIESEKRNTDLTKWFIQQYQKEFVQHISDFFPYIQGIHQRGKKRAALHKSDEVFDEKCFNENVLTCRLFFIMNDKISKSHQINCDKFFDYLIWAIGYAPQKDVDSQTKLIEVLQVIFKSDTWINSKKMPSLLETLTSLYSQESISQHLKQNIFSLLCSILLNNNLMELQKINCFQLWLSDLPNVICGSDTVSIEEFNIIYKLAVQKNTLFNQSIKSKLHLFINKLPDMKIVQIPDSKVSRLKLIGLLYWVKQWDTESLNILQEQLTSQSYQDDAKDFLIDLLKTRTEGLFM